MEFENLLPNEIEKRSFEIIAQELQEQGIVLPPDKAPVIMRCIHTSADFEYAKSLCFSDDALDSAYSAIREGACIVTDTQMARAGIHKKTLEDFGGQTFCFMSDEDVAAKAKEVMARK